MFLVSLFKASRFFIPDYNTSILQLLRISTHIRYFSNSYVICTSTNNYKDNKSRKLNFNELEEELINLPDIQIHNEMDLYIGSCFLPEPEVNYQISSKNNQQEQISIVNNNTEEDINYFFNKILEYFKRHNKLNKNTILLYFDKMIKIYEFNSNIINEKEFIVKIEEIFKKIIKKFFLLTNYGEEKYTILNETWELSIKALKNDIDGDKIRSLYELLLDINFEDDFSKDKQDLIVKLKDNFTNTKDLNEMEENIKKIFDENKKYFEKTYFIKFLYFFF